MPVRLRGRAIFRNRKGRNPHSAAFFMGLVLAPGMRARLNQPRAGTQ
jgi:hypothetical protein